VDGLPLSAPIFVTLDSTPIKSSILVYSAALLVQRPPIFQQIALRHVAIFVEPTAKVSIGNLSVDTLSLLALEQNVLQSASLLSLISFESSDSEKKQVLKKLTKLTRF
jgi:hypothetical protein